MRKPETESTAVAAGAGTRRGFVLVMAATAFIGIAGYVIQWLVPNAIGLSLYSVFAVFWSFTFLITAALSGMQQEITRATRPVEQLPEADTGRAARFAGVAALAATLAVIASAPAWLPAVFPGWGWAMVWPLATATGSYVLLTVLCGTLYGVSNWTGIFWAILLDGVLRLVLIGIVLIVTSDPVVLAWAVALPFLATFAVVRWITRRAVHGRTALDVGYRALTWNVARTIVAATAMGLLVSGYPLLLRLTARESTADELGLVILVSTLVRAPLIVVGMALQSYFVVLFRTHAPQFWRILSALLGIVVAAGIVLAALGWFFGPTVFAFLFPAEPLPSSALVASLALSSAVIGALCITAPAVLSQSRHSIFTAGWVTAGIVTVIALLLPIPLEPRVVVSLVFGPLAGLLVHVTFLVVARRSLRRKVSS